MSVVPVYLTVSSIRGSILTTSVMKLIFFFCLTEFRVTFIIYFLMIILFHETEHNKSIHSDFHQFLEEITPQDHLSSTTPFQTKFFSCVLLLCLWEGDFFLVLFIIFTINSLTIDFKRLTIGLTFIYNFPTQATSMCFQLQCM